MITWTIARPGHCVHCDYGLGQRDRFVYPVSGEPAHINCVSQPSLHQMDRLLVEEHERQTIVRITAG